MKLLQIPVVTASLSQIFVALSVIIALLAAIFTFEQVLVARDTEHRQLRAYVGFVPLDSQPDDIGRFALKNFGQTPANKVRVFGDTRLLPGPVPDQKLFDYTNSINLSTSISKVVFPTDSIPIEFWTDAGLEQTIKSWPSNKSLALFTLGKITYQDVFGATHETFFCVFYNYGQTRANRCARGEDDT